MLTLSVHDCAQGLFSGAGHGRHSGHFRSAAKHFVRRHVGAAAGLAKVILEDPAVESLSSFIGIDGTNTTLNSGRIQINLKPLDERKTIAEIIRRLQTEVAKVEGITLYMQPVQDLTVEDRVSRTQYQYSLEDPDAKELGDWVPQAGREAETLPQLRDVASDQQNEGLQNPGRSTATRPRGWASRRSIDNTLYDAFGQRQVSIMFTQLNQYRVVLEVEPRVSQQNPEDAAETSTSSPPADRQVPLERVHALRAGTGAAGDQPPGAVSGGDVSFNLAPGCLAGRCGEGDRQRRRRIWTCPQAFRPFQGTARAFQASLSNEPG